MSAIPDLDLENYLARFESRGFNLSSFARSGGAEYHAARLLPEGRLDLWARARADDEQSITRIEAAAWEFPDRSEKISVQLAFLAQAVDLKIPSSNGDAAAEWVLSRGPWVAAGEATSELFGSVLVRLMGQKDGRAVSIMPGDREERRGRFGR